MTTPAGRLDRSRRPRDGRRSCARIAVAVGLSGAAVRQRVARPTATGDDDHLLAPLEDQIRTVPGVRGCESSVHRKLSKQTYPWGTR